MIDRNALTDLAYLNALLGKRVHFLGAPHHVVEVLQDGPQIVLIDDDHTSVQDNAYGRAYRRTHQAVLVPIFVSPGVLNPDLESLDLLS